MAIEVKDGGTSNWNTKEQAATEQVEKKVESASTVLKEEKEEINKDAVAEEVVEVTEEIEKTEEEILASGETEISENKETVPETDEEKSHKRDKAAEKRIAKLIREREYLKGQLAAQSQQANQAQVETQPLINESDAPNPANYPNKENDIEFLVDYKLYQRDLQKKEEQFKTKQQEALKKYSDLPDLLAADQYRVTVEKQNTSNPTVVQFIKESDIGTDLWHYLLANPEQAITIAKLNPIQTAKELTKLEIKLAEKTSPTTIKPTEVKKKVLPAPLTPVKPSPSVNTKASHIEVY
jgi:hypothetical protein